MSLNVGKEVAVLERMTVRELKERYAELFGEETPTHNRAWLFKRIAWRIQSLAEGNGWITSACRSRSSPQEHLQHER